MKYLILLVLSLSAQETFKKNEKTSYYKVKPKLFEEKIKEPLSYIQCPTPWEEYKNSTN